LVPSPSRARSALGNFDDDIDREKPLRAMTQSIPATSIIHFRGGA
jgi:hypothetical protein